MKRYLLLALVAVALPALAADITWTPPTSNTDGSTAPLLCDGYNLFAGPAADSLTKIVDGSVLNRCAMTAYTATLPAGTKFIAMQTWACPTSGCLESAISAALPVPAASPVPSPPTGVSVTIPVVVGLNMAPVYKRQTQRSDVVQGFVPLNTACIGAPVYTYRTIRFRAVDKAAVAWWAVSPVAVVAPCS